MITPLAVERLARRGSPGVARAGQQFAAFRRASAEKELAEAIAAAREARLSWREVGETIGTTGEAARQRYAAS